MTMTSEPYAILLGHNRWANAEILRRCERLSGEQFHQRFEIGPGSLHDTMTHVIGAILRWSDRIGQQALRPSIESVEGTKECARRTPAELLQLNVSACEGFDRVFQSQRPHLAEVREWKFPDGSHRFTVSAAIIHVTNHGMHHRAQCMNMLRHLGAPVNADLDELEWQLAGEP